MHELAIAEGIASVAARHAGGRRVERVEVRVGHLRQVVRSALEFSFEVVARDTPLEGAELVIDEVPARVRCRGCGAETEARGFPLRCARCRGFDVEVTAGDELVVDALELSDVTEEVSCGS
jgi:hydrogenase nickel incorporation protein HypA/HybF